MNAVTAHWQVKLVALFLAVALWFYTSAQARVTKTMIVKADAASLSLPKDYQIIRIEPREFTVEIDAPITMQRTLKLEAITPVLVVSAESLASGTQTFPVSNRVLGLEADVRIKRIQPETVSGITVAFGRTVEDSLAVEVPKLEDVPTGLEPSVALTLTRVKVRGPREVIESMVAQNQKIHFLPISLSGEDANTAAPIVDKFQLTPEVSANVEVQDSVIATVTLKPVVVAKQIVNLPLHLLIPKDFARKYEVEISQPQVAITVHGPENLLKALKPEEDLCAYLNLRRNLEPNVTQELPVNVLTPAWLTYDAATVRVTLTLVAARAPAAAPPVPPPGDQPAPPK